MVRSTRLSVRLAQPPLHFKHLARSRLLPAFHSGYKRGRPWPSTRRDRVSPAGSRTLPVLDCWLKTGLMMAHARAGPGGPAPDLQKGYRSANGVFNCTGRQGRHREDHHGRPLVKYLLHHHKTPVLAVDADSNSNLNEVLGVAVCRHARQRPRGHEKGQVPSGMTKDVFMSMKLEQAVAESDGFDLIVMGRPEGSGCYCAANSLLVGFLEKLVDNYPYIVMDNEAGMEHVSRLTTKNVERPPADLGPVPAGTSGGAAHRRAGPGAQYRSGEELPHHQPGQGAAFRRGAQAHRGGRGRAGRHRAGGPQVYDFDYQRPSRRSRCRTPAPACRRRLRSSTRSFRDGFPHAEGPVRRSGIRLPRRMNAHETNRLCLSTNATCSTKPAPTTRRSPSGSPPSVKASSRAACSRS